MALTKVLLFIAIIAVVSADYEVPTTNKTQEAVAAKKEQKTRIAVPDPVRGSFQKLTTLMNRTGDDRTNRRKTPSLNKLLKLSRKHDMLNDNEGTIAISQKTAPENDTNTLKNKMKVLRPKDISPFDANHYNKNYVPQVTGVFCDFENHNGSIDMCMWQWNSTVSSHNLGFQVATAADLVVMNDTTRGLKFSGPQHDSDRKKDGKN